MMFFIGPAFAFNHYIEYIQLHTGFSFTGTGKRPHKKT